MHVHCERGLDSVLALELISGDTCGSSPSCWCMWGFTLIICPFIHCIVNSVLWDKFKPMSSLSTMPVIVSQRHPEDDSTIAYDRYLSNNVLAW